ncbi:1598_t:CDS:2, partial [Ambispora leptoticha]
VAENVKLLGHVLKTNVAACSSIGSGYSVQLGKIYLHLLELYKAVSKRISDAIVEQAEDLEQVKTHLLPTFFQAVLIDYNQNVEPARDAEVLSVMATIISRLGVNTIH